MTFAVWALALASVVYWGLLASSEPAAAPAGVLAEARTPIDTGAVAKSLGAMGAAPVAAVNPSTRFVLSGVIAGHSSSGAALISIDGKPPKPYRVGSVVDGDLLLQSVAPRRAELAARLDGPPAFALEMPVRK
ncbi:type II secretion system protein N [Rhodoferax sp.]|uniref:type II secretion system protein N n=1 Tax=Rhodoferax sp. TaxID=50421 RepID=UPI00374C9008